MKANLPRVLRSLHRLLCVAAGLAVLAGPPLHAEEKSVPIAAAKKLTPEEEKDMQAASHLYDEASAYRSRHKYAEAVAVYREIVKVYGRVLGSEHYETLLTRRNLAGTLRLQGKHADAVVEYRAVLAVYHRSFAPTYTETTRIWNDVADTLYEQGKHVEAEAEYRAVLVLMLRGRGPENENTLETQMRLANVLQAQGKNSEAEQNHRAVIKVKERVMGATHPALYQSCFHLALCLESEGKLVEALEFMLRAEHGWEKLSYRENTDFNAAKATRERIEAALKKEG